MSEKGTATYHTSKSIGVRDLKNGLTAIVRSVREEQTRYIVTVHGKPVAVLRPYTTEDAANEKETQYDKALSDLLELAERIDAAWQSPKSGVEILEEMREESAWR